jgi:gliding motility-associated transport system ATP-binding protein
MSIKVNKITKKYGEQKALDNISLEIKTGEIVGLLGPNGAGKTTMMKILTCYIPPTTGSAEVSELDVQKESIKVRRKVGYLPETNPLYYEMYVKEYLNFVAGIHKVKDRKKKVAEMIELTGLTPEAHKKIAALSKGYKQRVGIAQAMIHEPEVLILDEPTSGLDPNQIVEIRNLIKKIGKEKTVLLSTHIMQEVEAMCDRVVIINKGKIVADDNTENIYKYAKAEQKILEVEFDKPLSDKLLLQIKGINKVENNKNQRMIYFDSKEDIRKEVFNLAVKENTAVISMNMQDASIESVFRELTK